MEQPHSLTRYLIAEHGGSGPPPALDNFRLLVNTRGLAFKDVCARTLVLAFCVP